MLTFEQYQNDKTTMTVREACGYLQIDPEFFEGVKDVLVYDSYTFIERLHDGMFSLTIGRETYQSLSLPKLEAMLYFQWYVSEHVVLWTLDDLTKLWAEFCDCYDLVHEDAMQAALRPYDEPTRKFIGWFIRTWEDVEANA